MAIRLVSLTDGPTIVLDKPVLLVGRHPDCDVTIDSKKISRRHCCLAHVNGAVVVRDLGSTNGVWINGQRVGEARVNPGDKLAIANVIYRLRIDDEPAGPKIRNGSSPATAEDLPPDDGDIQIVTDE